MSSVCPSNLSLCTYCLNLCLSRLKWNDNGETKLHVTPNVPEFSDLGISPTFLPFSIFHTIVRGMLLNCKSNYAITLFKTLQCLLTIYKIVSNYLILTYEALHALILGYHFTLSLAITLPSTPHPALQSGRTGGNF